MSTTTGLIEDCEEGLVVLTLSNPGKLNAFTQSMRDALTDALRRLNQDPGCGRSSSGADGNFSAVEAWRGRSHAGTHAGAKP